MPALNYAQAYSQALAQAYPYVLHFAALRSAENDSRYRWTGANTIQIPSLSTTGRVDADRDTIGVAKRNFDNAWEPKTLANHRKWSTLVHPLDIDETNQVASIQNITKVFNEEQKFPEMDAYLISKLYAEWTAAGGVADSTALTPENILTTFDGYMVAMDEANVPKVGRILYTTPAIKSMLKNAKELTRFIQNGDAAIQRAVSSLEEVKIEDVPSALMKTVYDFTEGWKAGAGAQQINMALAHPSAVITPEKYTFAQLDSPSAGSEGKWVYFEEAYDDVFLLGKRKDAVMFNIGGGLTMKTVQRGNKQLRVADDHLEDMVKAGYVEVDGKTGKPVNPPTREADAAALKKENKALKAQVKELTAQVEALTAQLDGAATQG